MSKTTIKLSAGDLAAAMTSLARIIEKKNTIPILSNMVLRPVSGGLRLEATDLDIMMSTKVPAAIDGPGDPTTVPGHLAADIVKKWKKGETVELAWEGSANATIKSGRSRFTLQTLPASDFPDLAAGEFPHRFAIPAELLASTLDRAKFAISTEETRYYLNGVYLHSIEKGDETLLRAVATDGHRMARIDAGPLPDYGARGMPGIIVPRRTVLALDRLLDKGNIQVDVSANKIRFTIGETVLTSKLIDGTFPDYDRVIPKGNNKTARLDRAELTSALDRVSTISSERGRAVKMSFRTGQVELDITNPDQGTAHEDVDANYDAPHIEVGFNSRYLLDILAVMPGNQVVIAIDEPGNPALITDAEAPGATFVLMPMRV